MHISPLGVTQFYVEQKGKHMTKFFVKKPYFVLVAVIIILIIGGVSLGNMSTDLMPNMEVPYLMVITTEPGASPNKVERDITEPMESTLGTPNLSQAIRIKKLQENGVFSKEKIEELLSEIKQKDIDRVVFKNEQLYRYFPSYYTAEQMKREILTLLKINMTFE
mgnify:CR=1 FL=1